MTPAEIEARIHEGVPLAGLFAIQVVSAGEGMAVLRLPPAPLLLRPGNTLSGPAIMALCDVAIWGALLTMTRGEDNARTQQLAISFLRPAGPGPLLAEARIIRRGARVVYAEVWLRAEDSDTPCGHCTSSWMIVA